MFTKVEGCFPLLSLRSNRLLIWLIVLILGINSLPAQTFYTCPGDTLILNNVLFTEPGQYNIRFVGSQGQDSMVSIAYRHYPAYEIWQLVERCPGDVYDPVGVVQSDTMIWRHYRTVHGCDSIVAVWVDVVGVVGLDVYGDRHLCTDASTVLSTGFYNSYRWSTGDTSKSIVVASPGIYSVTVGNTMGCIDSTEVLVSQSQFDLDYTVTEVGCKGYPTGAIEINSISGNQAPFAFYWEDGSQSYFRDSLLANSYTLMITDSMDCAWAETIDVTEPSRLQEIFILPSSTTYFEGDTLRLSFSSTYAPESWRWSLPGDKISNNEEVTLIAALDTIHIYVVDEYGCEQVESYVLQAKKTTGFVTPNIFSPNGDGANDYLIVGADKLLESIHFIRIFDRWGNRVYALQDIRDPSSIRWDGRVNGQKVRPGAYMMLISYTYHGITKTTQQMITII